MCKLLEVNERSLFAAEEKAMKFSDRMRAAEALLILSVGGLLLLYEGNPAGMLAFAQTSESQSQAAEAKEVPIDEYSRSAQVYYMQRMGKGGWERGQEIYYQKCWICHNDYTIQEEPTGAPTLRDLYKRPKLRSGQPVNDQTVTAQIRNGSVRMPSYGPVLNDKDLSDLVTYLREKCCWDEENPPANPRYRAR